MGRPKKIISTVLSTVLLLITMPLAIWYCSDVFFNQKRIGKTSCYLSFFSETSSVYLVKKNSFFQQGWNYVLVDSDITSVTYDDDGNMIAMGYKETKYYYYIVHEGERVYEFSSLENLNNWLSLHTINYIPVGECKLNNINRRRYD